MHGTLRTRAPGRGWLITRIYLHLRDRFWITQLITEAVGKQTARGNSPQHRVGTK